MKGLFISVEGVEGSGKSTQIALLKDQLEERGVRVDVTREPGGTAIGETIRAIVLDPKNERMDAVTEVLLYAASRAQHVRERILPALMSGITVISDRYCDSTTAYQGAGRSLPLDQLQRLHEIATGGLWPDLTILIDLPAKDGLGRATRYRESDRIERESLEFHERVRKGFLDLAASSPDRIVVVDGLLPLETVAKHIAAAVFDRLKTARTAP